MPGQRVGALHPLGVLGERLSHHADGFDFKARGLVLLPRGVQEFDGLGDLPLVVRGVDPDEGRESADLGPLLCKGERRESEGEEKRFPHATVIPRLSPAGGQHVIRCRKQNRRHGVVKDKTSV